MTNTSGPTTMNRSAQHRSQSDYAVEVDALTLRYDRGRFTAVDSLNLSVAAGECYALLGSNGAGKTSALEVIEGFRAPTSGRARIFGHDPMDRAQVRPRLGIMLQEAGMPSELTLREAIALGGALSGRQDRVERVMEVVELSDKASVKVEQLSGGQRRRLDFAIAIWGSPEVLFLDEPTTGLDPAARDRLWQVVRGLKADGATVILTTHYLAEAQEHADRIGLMHAGTLQREGTVAQLVADETSTIRFRVPAGASVPLVITETVNGVAHVSTTDLQADLTRLLLWARDEGVELHELAAEPSSLDDVFRALVA